VAVLVFPLLIVDWYVLVSHDYKQCRLRPPRSRAASTLVNLYGRYCPHLATPKHILIGYIFH
jgi:hypothetical protein